MISEKLTAPNVTFRLPQGLAPDHDLAWFMAGDYGRKMFWLEAGKVGKEEWAKDIVLGIGPRGKLRAISEEYKKVRKSRMDRTNKENPPLTPASSQVKSRVISYLRFRLLPDGVLYYWIYDWRVKMGWGYIMEYQAHAGREVRGFTQRATVAVRQRMQKWWKANRVRLALRGQLVTDIGEPKPVHEMFAPAPAPIHPAAPKPRTPRKPRTPIAPVLAGSIGRAPMPTTRYVEVIGTTHRDTFNGYQTGPRVVNGQAVTVSQKRRVNDVSKLRNAPIPPKRKKK